MIRLPIFLGLLPLRWRQNGRDSVSNHQPHNVNSTVYSDADRGKHQNSASLAFVRGIHRGPVNSPRKWPVTRKMFPFDDVIMFRVASPHSYDYFSASEVTLEVYYQEILYSNRNTLRPRLNGRHFTDKTHSKAFLNEDNGIWIKISLMFLPKDPINNISALVQIIAWPRPGDKPVSEPMLVSLLTHICVTRPQWVKVYE